MSQLYLACDMVDSCIFTGGALWNNADARNILREHIARWERALEEAEKADQPPPVAPATDWWL